jgi:ribulose-phosphate 3-epimerase
MSTNKAFGLLQACSPTVSVGILSADLMHLSSELALLEGTDIKMIHFDVMDGCFVPMMTIGPLFIKAVKTHLLKDVHLMIQDPENKVEDYVHAGADMITIHVESSQDVRPILLELGRMENKNDPDRGLIRGIALNPDTPVERLEPLLDDIEMAVVLAVDPKVKGFPFFDSVGNKFAEVKEIISAASNEILLCVDGGIKRSNIAEIAKLGADIVVSGSAIFDGTDPVGNVRFMLNIIQSQAS